MSDSKGEGFTLPWPTIMTLLVITGGVWLSVDELTSSRPPPGTPLPTPETHGYFDVDARLWQDPLAAAFERREAVLRAAAARVMQSPARQKPSNHSRPIDGHSVAALKHEISSAVARAGELTRVNRIKVPSAAAAPVLILPVMIKGGPYPENAESRLRSRQAILSGLTVGGFVPRDGEHLAYFEVAWPERVEPDVERLQSDHVESSRPDLYSGPTLVVPYEWFEARSVQQSPGIGTSAYASAVVLWLKDEAFDDKGIVRLAKLIGELKTSATGSPSAATAPTTAPSTAPTTAPMDNAIEVHIIGPRGSDTLRNLISDAERLANQRGVSIKSLQGAKLLSATATADPEFLLHALRGKRVAAAKTPANRTLAARTIVAAFQAVGLGYERVIGSDWVLSQALVTELRNRGVDPAKDVVAIVGEWDTLYARANTFAFASAATGAAGMTPEKFLNALEGDPGKWPSNIKRLNYLRGIDGRLPNDEAVKRPADDRQEPNTAQRVPKERSEGRDQSDYLRRLVNELKAWDNKSRYDDPKGGLKAVGVLGSDVYDKLLVLRSLRRHFPGVLFFTTDLDTRLIHSDEIPGTHNLIVASHYGLRVRPLADRIAPFRDSYQTSLLCATLRVLRPQDLHFGEELQDLPPRLHEVGRTRLVDISMDRRGQQQQFIHPERADQLGWWSPARFVTAMLGAGLAGLLLYWSLKPRRVLHHRGVRVLLLTAPVVLLLIALISVSALLMDRWLSFRPAEEPQYFGQGVSVWPTVWLRILAAFLSAHFLAKAIVMLRQSDKKLTKDFCLWESNLPDPLDQSPARPSWWRRLWLRIMGTWEAPPGPRIDAVVLWHQYLARGTLMERVWRFVPATVLYIGLGICAGMLLGFPHAPVRGDVSQIWEKASLFVSVFLLVSLMFFVVDATRLCERFTEHVCRNTEWPPELLRRVATSHQLHPRDLDEYLDVKIIGRRTEVVLPLIYYPFVVLSLMIISRNSYFDNWDWPTALLLIFAVNASYALVCGWVLRQACERARRASIEGIEKRMRPLIASPAPADQQRRERLQALIEEIRANRHGAFAPFSQNPVVRALLLPSGGFGLWAILEYLAKH